MRRRFDLVQVGELVGRNVDAVICTCPTLVADVAREARRYGVLAVGVDELPARAVPALMP